MTAPDQYNTFGNVNWNRTYGPTEPQQIHISLANDAKYAKVQFATSQAIQGGQLKYWSKKQASNNKAVVITTSEDWTFVDGGNAKRPLYLHNIQTDPLQPATIYQYQVGAVSNSSSTIWSPIFEFHTASKSSSFKFIATGDIGVNNAVAMEQMVKLAGTHQYDFITVSGDQAYDMADFDGIKGDEFMNFAQQIYSTVPYIGVTGNHEGAYNFSHYKNRFNIVPYQESKSEDALFYSFNYKSLHLVSFSTEVYLKQGSHEQVQTALNWLDEDLTLANEQRHLRPWIILITHHPIYCSDNSTDCTVDAPMIRNGPIVNGAAWGGLEPILLKHKVDLYLAGHVHNYERTYPLSNDTLQSTSYHNPPSFFQVINGNAGNPGAPTPFSPDDPHADWSAKRYGSFGFSEFKVSPTTLKLTHHAVNTDGSLGQIIDQVSVTKSLPKRK
ncbi:Metallo-dependent phosphatase-like protein [Halteromyces radiatus]|uniref:Metallo-dependent phosphatase-like protein n=1 Tax=Halteromyces radiatus TaxID=101107 RepID=UPI002220CDA2|nr:Metallo-dependent phosphatase-like protein [Halteromyces radiatus]KAI8086736.1 Metallo-dependent phosphatase-like protein [Halteromyces radiatus]